MATKPSEPNKFLGLKKTIAALHKDVAFFKKCLKYRITPRCCKIRVKSSVPAQITRRMEKELIKNAIKRKYSQLDTKTLECYALHLKLAKEFPVKFQEFLARVNVAAECEADRKRKLLDKKLNQLRFGSSWKQTTRLTEGRRAPALTTTPKVQPIEGLVINRSTTAFTGEQLTHLNKGLGYAISTKPDVEQIIIDVETAIFQTQAIPINSKNAARSKTWRIIKEGQKQEVNNNEARIVKELKEKPVYYMKADKGNAVVIMDKEDYDQQLQTKIDNGPYRQQRVNPLPEIVKKTEKVLKECKPIIGNTVLREPNPILPRIKGLPKIHKPGNEMREIVSAVGSPTHKLAKWLVQEFQTMPNQFESRSVTNTQEFAEQLQSSGEIQKEEIMVSFDVAALFPSVPVKDSINLLEKWLLSQRDAEDSTWKLKVKMYLKLTRLCMEENYFSFRGNFFKQTKGAPMGNPLSPFLCELFMANMESTLKDNGILPSRWWRYVDDVFSVVKRDSLPQILEAINSVHKDIRFTHEIEHEGKLAFLDLLVIRESSSPSTYEYEVYRKPTSTKRVIPYTSNHSFQHKMAAFHHMIHRMQTLPLKEAARKKELEYIMETAQINGYKESTIQAIIRKKEKLQRKKALTTLSADTEPLKRVSIPFDNIIAVKLRSQLKKFGLDLVFSSRHNQLKTLLGSTKDPVDLLNKAGVYKIVCKDCDKVYIGQTKRTLETRFEEHVKEVNKAKQKEDKGLHYHFTSKVAEHIFREEHQITTEDIKILRTISKPWKLDVAESLEINKEPNSSLLNRDRGNGYTWLFNLLPKQHRQPSSGISTLTEN